VSGIGSMAVGARCLALGVARFDADNKDFVFARREKDLCAGATWQSQGSFNIIAYQSPIIIQKTF